jgi:hypothetical protein
MAFPDNFKKFLFLCQVIRRSSSSKVQQKDSADADDCKRNDVASSLSLFMRENTNNTSNALSTSVLYCKLNDYRLLDYILYKLINYIFYSAI